MMRSQLVFTLLATLVGVAPLRAQAPSTLSPPIARRIDSLFAPFARPGSPGYAVGIVRRGQLVFAKGYGRANLDDDIPITPRTAFHLASLSKQFVGGALALLIQDGKLTLDSRVADLLPEATNLGDMQVKHLVYFTSGIPEYTSLPRANGQPWFSPYYFTIDEAIATSLRAPHADFAPGTQWAYSNVDYMLLARIIERVSGQPLATVLRRRIFDPLGMTASDLNDDATLVIPHRATGYASRTDSVVLHELATVNIKIRPGRGYVRLVRNSPHYGGSGVFSTVEDLARWDRALAGRSALGRDFATLMLHRERFAHDKDNDAFGLVVGSYLGHVMIWFSGGDLDTSTFMARFPDDDLTIICLSNMPTGDAEGHAKEVVRLLLSEQPAH